jgi:hypothetical protein
MSYIVGIGVYTFVLYLFTLMGGKLTLTSVSLLAITLLIVAYFLPRKGPIFRSSVPLQIGDWILLALFIPLFGVNLYVAWLTPIYWPDAIYYYDGIGRIIAIDGMINMPFLAGDLYFYGLNALSMQLIHAVTYIISTDRVAVLYSGFYLAFVLMFYSFRPRSDQLVFSGKWEQLIRSFPRLVFALAVASTPFIFAMGYVVLNGLPAAVYLFAGILVWTRFKERPSSRLAFLTGLMLSLCSWTRYDGVLFCCLVELLTLYLATYNEAIRKHLFVLVAVPAVMTCFRYVNIFMSGQSDRFGEGIPIPFLDLWIDLIVAALGALVCWAGLRPLRILRTIAQGLVILGGISLAVGIALFFSGFLHSITQLRKLVFDPIWGATLLLAIIIAFSRSLFCGVPKLFLVLIFSFVALRILLYAGLSGPGWILADASITHSGNRLLLYIWPLFIYWVSCSKEMPRLFSFSSGT